MSHQCVHTGSNEHGATLVYIRFRSNSTRGVSHHGLAIYIKKYLKAKEEI